MAISLPRIGDSNGAPRELTAMRVNGEPRDSGRGLCYAILIGCMISMCSTMPLLSIRTHSSHSQTGVTPSSRFGCLAQTAVQLTATNPLVLLLRELVTLNSLIHCHRTQRSSWCCVKAPQRSGSASLTGLRNMAAWSSLTCIRTTCPSMGRPRQQLNIL